MKKTLRLLGAAALLLAAVLCFSGCTAVFERMFAPEGDFTSASRSEHVGFLLSVPRTWICHESVIADGDGGFAYLVSATFSNSDDDNANVTAVSLPSSGTPEETFLALFEKQKGQFEAVSEATGDNYALDGQMGRMYEYTVTKRESAEKTQTYGVMQLLVSRDGRTLLFTYTAKHTTDPAETDNTYYTKNYKTVSEVLGKLVFDDFTPPTVLPGEGMVEISDGETQKFHLSVPAGWVKGVTGRSDYCKALSPDGNITVSAFAFLPQLSGDISIANYWAEAEKPELSRLFGESFTVSEEGVTADFAGTKGGRYAYSGVSGGVRYYFVQYFLLVGNSLTPNIYELTLSSTSPIDPAAEPFAAIIGSYGF